MILDAFGACALDLQLQLETFNFEQSRIGESLCFDLLGLGCYFRCLQPGGVLKGEMSGSWKLLLTSDRKSFTQLTIEVKTVDGLKIAVTFAADDSEPVELEDECFRWNIF